MVDAGVSACAGRLGRSWVTTAGGDTAGEGAEPHRLQWSHAWLGAGSGAVGDRSATVSLLPPLWQMTENGSTTIADPRAAVPPHKTVCMAIAVIARMLKSRLKRAGIALLGSRRRSTRL